MKEMWTEPRIEVQKFAANEYVAACEGGGTKYWFQCNAGSTHSGDNVVYEETNGMVFRPEAALDTELTVS